MKSWRISDDFHKKLSAFLQDLPFKVPSLKLKGSPLKLGPGPQIQKEMNDDSSPIDFQWAFANS